MISAGIVIPAMALSVQTEILVWGINIGPDSKGTQSVIREFERLNPQYKVRVLGMGAGGMDPQKLMTSIVGNVAPDAVVQDRFALSDWASRGAFRSLNSFIDRDRGNDPLCPTPEQYYPAPWNEAIYEGKLYGIPVAADDRILYINRGLFRKAATRLRAAGLDPEGVPKTWSEVLAYSKVLTERKPDGSLIRAGFMPNFGNCWLYMYAFQTNASFMSKDGRTCTLYSPESERALQFMLDGYEIVGGYENAKSFESGFQSGINDAFVTGKVAMKVDGDWILKDLARYGPQVNIDVGPPPVPDDRFAKTGVFANEKDTFVSWMGGFAYAIPKGARNPEGAWDFIKFATSEKGRIIEIQGQQSWEKRRGRIFIPAMVAHRPTNERILTEFMPPIERYAKGLKMHIEMAKVCRGRPPTFVAQTLW
ncbi:MAG: ABC transporter substrate-binding protein, partial [Fimbriimonadaceae bacterium]